VNKRKYEASKPEVNQPTPPPLTAGGLNRTPLLIPPYLLPTNPPNYGNIEAISLFAKGRLKFPREQLLDPTPPPPHQKCA